MYIDNQNKLQYREVIIQTASEEKRERSKKNWSEKIMNELNIYYLTKDCFRPCKLKREDLCRRLYFCLVETKGFNKEDLQDDLFLIK